jgi:hypothetical protein
MKFQAQKDIPQLARILQVKTNSPREELHKARCLFLTAQAIFPSVQKLIVKRRSSDKEVQP